MADGTKIEWTDATVNAVNGCSVISPGCTNCYAMRLAGTRLRNHPSRAGLTQDSKAGPVWNGKVRLNETALLQPLSWKRPRRIFWNAHGDLFYGPEEWIDRCFAVMAMTPQHQHQVLTKRPDRMRQYLTAPDWARRISAIVNSWPSDQVRQGNEYIADFRLARGAPLPNVWLGTSVEDQPRADRIDHLRATPAAIRFVSFEPLLGPVIANLAGIHWAIVGGESGPGARPMHPDWARSLRDQCAAAGVWFFFKQWGEWRETDGPETTHHNRKIGAGTHWLSREGTLHRDAAFSIYHDYRVARLGKKAAGRLLDGVEHNGMPA